MMKMSEKREEERKPLKDEAITFIFGPRNCFMLRHCLIQCLFIKMPAKISTKEPSIFECTLRVRT
jgi:hypothetical protein